MAQGPDLDRLIFWDLKNGIEADSYTISPEAEVMFDDEGKAFIADRDSVLIGNPGGTRTKAYRLNIDSFPKKYLFHGIDLGYRVNS